METFMCGLRGICCEGQCQAEGASVGVRSGKVVSCDAARLEPERKSARQRQEPSRRLAKALPKGRAFGAGQMARAWGCDKRLAGARILRMLGAGVLKRVGRGMYARRRGK